MNFVQNMAMKQAESQLDAFLPKDLKEDKQKDDEAVNVNDKKPKKTGPKKKRRKIDKTLVIRMYSVLLFHTLSITILTFIFRFGKGDDIPEQAKTYELYICLGCILIGFLLSLLVSKVKFITKARLNYLFYFVLYAVNAVAFILAGYKSFFPQSATILIMIDAGAISILILAIALKENPSTFWMMLACGCGCLLTWMVLLKVFQYKYYYIIFFGIFAAILIEYVTYVSLESYQANAENQIVPSMMSLPYELNLSAIFFIIKFFQWLYGRCVAWCCPKKRK